MAILRTPWVAVAAALWLVIDATRVWAPSLITIFGQAASTPPEVMGLFALACLAVPVALTVWAWHRPRVAGVAGVGAALAGVAMTLGPGGQWQLWSASLAVALSVTWFAVVAARSAEALAPGVAAGWLLSSGTHAFLGTWGAVWREDLWLVLAWVAPLLVGAAAVDTLRQGAPGAAGSGTVGAAQGGAPAGTSAAQLGSIADLSGWVGLPRRQALALLPLLLLGGVTWTNVGRASVVDAGLGPVLLVLGCGLAWVLAAARSTFLSRGCAALLVTAAVALSLLAMAQPGDAPRGRLVTATLLIVVHLIGPIAAVHLLRVRPHLSRAAWPVAAGGLVWVVLFFAYYAGYDLGYRADWVLVLGAALITGALVPGPSVDPSPATGAASASPGRPARPSAGAPTGWSVIGAGSRAGLVGGVLGVTAAAVGPPLTVTASAPMSEAPTESATVVAYNLRMGYGMDGRFDPRAVAGTLAGSDVALLSEVDRGWLLNGGQDQLAILARLTGAEPHFAPAADPVWGDAVLTRHPTSGPDSVALPSHGAVTGAGALLIDVDVTGSGSAWTVVSTHIQPTTADDDGTLAQTRDLASVIEQRRADGAPLVLGGDFNFEPGTPSWEVLLGLGLTDALESARPLPTSDAADPQSQIDHLFIGPGLAATDPRAPGLQASDHLPVVAEVSVTNGD